MKNLLCVAVMMAGAIGALADTVDPTQNQFYFESQDAEGVRLKSSYGWTVSVSPGKSTKTSGTTTFQAILDQPFTTVEDWGLSDTMNIAAADWQGVTSTTFTYTHTADSVTKYLYMFVRYFRYRIAFNANGGSAVGSWSDICYTNSIVLPEASRTGYHFRGWTNATFTAALTGAKTGSDLGVSEDGATIALFAQWEPIESTVTFNKNGEGEAVSPSSKQVFYDAAYGPLPTPTWTGHKFLGWFTLAGGGTSVGEATLVSATANHELFAHWQDILPTLHATCDPDSGGNWVKVIGNNTQYGRTVTLTAIPGVPYDFESWADGVLDNPRSVVVTVDTNLVARFSLKKFEVAFLDRNGSEICAPRTVRYGESATAPDAPEHVGYTFAGWSDDFSMVVSNMSVVAQYAANAYTVVYDANGGSGLMTNDVVSYGQEFALQPNGYTRTLYDFAGWASTADATTNELEYSDLSTVSNLTDIANGTSRLYAVWRSQLSDLSVAADCTNLILECTNYWHVDSTDGFESPSSVCIEGEVMARMTGRVDRAGTLTFRVKATKASSSTVFSFFEGEWINAINVDDTGGDWVLRTCYINDPLVTWRYTGKGANDQYWVDQVHWYPGRSVTVDDRFATEAEKAEAQEAILRHWDDLLAADAATVTNVLARGNSVTNVAEILRLGVSPTTLEVNGTTATVQFVDVELPKDIALAHVTVDGLETVYTGSAIEPAVQSVMFGDEALVEGTHYALAYSGNTNAGTATITIKGIVAAGYGGTVTTNFTIAAKPLTGDMVAPIPDKIYTGSEFRPHPTVTDPDRGVLEEGTDYVLAWTDNVNVGEATVTVKGRGNYGGEVPVAFTIKLPAKTPVDVPAIASKIYNGNLQVADVPASSLYVVTANEGGTAVGEYDVVLTIANAKWYEWAGALADPLTLKFAITKATYDMSGAKWDYAGSFTYDGTAKTVLVTGLPDGVSVGSYEGNVATEPGTRTAHATLAYDEVNYYPPEIADLSWTIESGDSGGGSGGGGSEGGGSEGGGSEGGGSGGGTEGTLVSGTLNVNFAKAQTVTEALYTAAGSLAGIVQMKVGKKGKKGVKISASVMLVTGKKVTAKAVTLKPNADGTMAGTIAFKAPISAMSFEMAANGVFSMSNTAYAVLETVVGGSLPSGTADLLASLDPRPVLGVGYEFIEEILPVLTEGVVIPLSITGGKKMTAGKSATIKFKKVKAADGSVRYDLVGLDDAKKPNLSALKLTYAPKSGAFQGSFQLYASNRGVTATGKAPKLKKYTVTVRGFMLNEGDGFFGSGLATCKKLSASSWPVTIRYR